MNFIQDVVERFPSARPALLAIDADGERRVWHFGELFAMSAGLSGAMAARGVGRGDAVMTLVGSRVEWVLAMLACFRMGAVALPCNTQLRRKDLELRVSGRRPGALHRRGALPRRAARRRPLPRHVGPGARSSTRTCVRSRPRSRRTWIREDPAVIIFTSGTTGDPRGVVYPQRYLAGAALQAEHWFGAREGDLAWCTAATGLVEVDAQHLHRALAARSRGADPRRALRSRRALARSSSARASPCSARRRPSTGCWPSGPSCARSRGCGAWSRRASRSTPR